MASKNTFSGDSQLEIVTIKDFSPGIHRFSRYGYSTTYTTLAPLGSASSAIRCYFEPGTGLVPAPSYTPYISIPVPISPSATWSMATIGSLASLGIGWGVGTFTGTTVDHLVWNLQVGSSASATAYYVMRASAQSNISNSYTASSIGGNNGILFPDLWPNLEIGYFTNNASSTPIRAAITSDPCNSNINGTLVQVPSSSTVGNDVFFNGIAAMHPPCPTFYHGSRAGFFQGALQTTASFPNAVVAVDNLVMADIQSTANFYTAANTVNFFAEMGAVVGSWGSISTGEFFIVYQGGGGVVIYGDLVAPSLALKLPGAVGTGAAIGRSALTPAGLLYVSSTDGIQMWNGGNNSIPMSASIPDDQFQRTFPAALQQYILITSLTQSAPTCNVHPDAWGSWAMFGNNWMLDTETNGWWQLEDPNVMSFQVHARSQKDTKFFYSTPGLWYATASVSGLTGVIYQWDKTKPVLNYNWLSNPISRPGKLTVLQTVEVVASNPAATPATILVTPTSPTGYNPYPNNNNPQSYTLTIPPNSIGWRGSARFGYTDYNIQIQLTCSNTASQAPVVHEISAGFSDLPTSVS